MPTNSIESDAKGAADAPVYLAVASNRRNLLVVAGGICVVTVLALTLGAIDNSQPTTEGDWDASLTLVFAVYVALALAIYLGLVKAFSRSTPPVRSDKVWKTRGRRPMVLGAGAGLTYVVVIGIGYGPSLAEFSLIVVVALVGAAFAVSARARVAGFSWALGTLAGALLGWYFLLMADVAFGPFDHGTVEVAVTQTRV